jgi:hypothetical protein
MRIAGSIFKLLGTKATAYLILAAVLAASAWVARQYVLVNRLYAALSKEIVENEQLLVAKDVRLSELSHENKDIAAKLNKVRRGAIVEIHADASSKDTISGQVTSEGDHYEWIDPHFRFHFVDPNLTLAGDETLTVNQRFRLHSTTVELPDRTYAVRSKLFELSPQTGEVLGELEFDEAEVVSWKSRSSGQRRSSRLGSYIGIGMAYDVIDQEFTPVSLQVGFGYRFNWPFSKHSESISPANTESALSSPD